MKNKVFTFIVLFFSVVLLVGCKGNPSKTTNELLKESLNKLTLPTEVTGNLSLLTKVDNYQITWTSSNENVISNEGGVKRSSQDVIVTLTASITSEGVTESKIFDIKVIKFDVEELINSVLNQISLPEEVTTNIDLPDKIDGLVISWTSDNTSAITNKGNVKQGEEDVVVNLKASVSYSGVNKFIIFQVKVLKNENFDVINNVIDKVVVPTHIYENINLPTSIDDVVVTWQSTRSLYLTNAGLVTRTIEDVEVLLTATYSYNGYKIVKYYDVVVKGYSDEEKVQLVLDRLQFNEVLNSNLVLNTSLGYGTVATWNSSNTQVLTNDGEYTYDENIKTVVLTVIVTLGSVEMEKEFEFTIAPKEEAKKEHLIIVHADEYDSDKFNNVELKNGKLVLKAGANTGSYESAAIETQEFTSLVASWAAVSSTTSTVELQVKVRVNGVWSDYISYRPFGLGLQNACTDQTNSLIKLATDEVMVLNSKRADAVMFKVTLRTTANTTPELSLVCFALEIPGYTYPVDVSSYPTSLVHDVPRLYQGAVPTIGNSICSATSSTMLLKYKGEDFSAFDSEFEHRYIAGIVRDYGNKIYGNWVYNTVAMSGYGYDSYVVRLYSVNELIEYLATVGPCALSVKGQMTSDKKNYYTNGHLIVAIGYEFKDNGDLVIVCNDPNVPTVECRYTLSVINNTWRNIAYIIE